MWQTLISIIIVGIALFFIGRKVYRMIRQAVDLEQDISCDCGCSGCGVTNCDNKPK
jgi:attachment p12 family protein